MKISQKLQLDVVSNQTKPYHTIPNLTNPNQLYIFSKKAKNKSDLDENFTEVSDGCFLIPYTTKPNLTNPNQLYIFSKTAKTNQILMKISQKFQMDVFSNHTQPNITLPNQL